MASKFLLPFLAMLLLPSPAAQTNGRGAAGVIPLLQRQLDELTSGGRIPGVTFAARFRDGRTIALASGSADLERRRPMTPSGRMLSGSIGKTCVATIVLQLEAEKRLGVDDRLGKYFSGEPWFASLPNGSGLTLRMLLNHTGGLPEYVDAKKLWADVRRWPDKAWTPLERLGYIFGQPPLHPPGRGWSYADTHYILLGMVIERVTGSSYERELRRRILLPFGLTATVPADHRHLAGLIPGYSQLDEPFRIRGKVVGADGRYRFNPQLEWTGGGLLTCSRDLARWAQLLYGGQVLPPAALARMLERVKTSEAWDYGLGAIVWESGTLTTVGHSGFAPGYNSIMEYLPGYGLAVALQFNCDYVSRKAGKSTHEIAAGLLRCLLHGQGR